MKEWADAEARNDVHGQLAAIAAMNAADQLRVILFIGAGSLKHYGFGAEVGCA